MSSLTKVVTVTINDLDSNDYLKPSSILDFAQLVASKHADELGIGFNDFIKKDLIWVVVRNYFEVIKPIQNPDTLKVMTYPTKNKFVEYPRNYIIYDENNEEIIKGKSIWMIYNTKTKEVIMDNFKELENDDLKDVFDFRIKKLPNIDIKELDYCKDVMISASMCDHNKHLNNTRSLDFYIDVYEPKVNEIVKKFQIEYVKQVYKGDLISLYKYRKDNLNYLVGYRKNELVFCIMIEYF